MGKIVVGNWKMNLDKREAVTLTNHVIAYAEGTNTTDTEVVLCPPLLYLDACINAAGPAVGIGAQNCSEYENGAYTGEVSATMLKDIGCTHVIIGHSERRQHYFENKEMLLKKVVQAREENLQVIFCVGENSTEYKTFASDKAVRAQLKGLQALENLIIAYEPIWAIGSGKVPSNGEISHINDIIKTIMPASTKVLYGGSVNEQNIQSLCQIDNLDGFLVGGASIKFTKFKEILMHVG